MFLFLLLLLFLIRHTLSKGFRQGFLEGFR